MNFKLLASLVLTCFLVLFITQNVEVVEIRFMFWQLSMSRSLLIFFLLTIGVLVGWLMNSLFTHRSNKSKIEGSRADLSDQDTA